MNKRIYSTLTALAIALSSTVSVFAEYKPLEQPKDNGFFEFYEDFSECTNIVEGGNSVAGSWASIYDMNIGDPIITRDDGVKWVVSSRKSTGGGVFSAAYVDLTNDRLYVKGGGANQGMLRLDLSGALADGKKVKDLPQETQEFEFRETATSRSAAIGLFLDSTDTADQSYVMFGTKNGEDVSGLGGISAGAYVLFVQGGGISKKFTYPGPTSATWKIKVEDGIISWDMNNGTWTESTELDSSYLENCKYIAGFFGGGDSGGFLDYFSYKTGNAYTEDFVEPSEVVYLNTFDKTKVVNEEEGIYELSEPTIVRRVEYTNYSGGEFSLSTNGTDWDTFNRDYVKDIEDEDPDNDENKGEWTAKDTVVTGTNRWVNTCNTKAYKYVKVPTGERIIRGKKTGIFKVFKNISKNSSVKVRKGNILDLYLSKDSAWATTGFSSESSDTNYVQTDNNAAYIGGGYTRIKAKKETYSKDQAGTPIKVTVNGNSKYSINVTVSGPLSDALESQSVEDIDAYIASQQDVLDVLNTKIENAKNGVIGAMADVQAFFTDTVTPTEPDGVTPRKTINDIDACDANDFKTVDSKFAERIVTYGSFNAASFEDLENICDTFAREVIVGRFNDMGSENVQKVDSEGNPVVDENGAPVYYTTDELIAKIIRENADALSLPVNNKYYQKNTDDDDDGILDDSEFAVAIREQLANRVFASGSDLSNAIDKAVVMAVFNNNSNAAYMIEMLDAYRSTLGITAGSAIAAKLDEIKADTVKTSTFVQSIKYDASIAPSALDTPEKIALYISSYAITAPTPTPTAAPTGGGGTGGQSVVKTPINVVTKPDNTVAEKEQVFGDVPVNYWGYEAIRYMNAKGAVKGYEDGNYLPNNPVTKAEFVQMLMKIFNPDVTIPEDYENPFNDVTEDDWFANSIVKANILGVFSGNGISAEPNKKIERQEMASLIYRMVEKMGKTLSRDADVSRFNDEADIADWAYTPVMQMQAAGIISGDNGNFAPVAEATRAMAAQMLYKTMQGFEKPAEAEEVAE
ncbi:MAG: S-layer homology domain-containing protein [Clostridiales bacterium]|nr:S-layer homology domain-containing protein [Clostridiales bacterium]